MPHIISGIADAQDAMTSFIEKYKPLLYQRACMMANNILSPEDLVQETLTKVWAKRDKFLALSDPQRISYCIRTMRNLVINENKRGKVIEFVPDDNTSEYLSTEPTPEEFLFRKFEYDQIHCALEQLDERSRMLIERKYLLNDSDEIIANDMKIKPASVRMSFSRAKQKLKKLLIRQNKDN